MDLTPYLRQLREDLTAAASAGDEQTRRTAAVLGVALEPAARLAIMNAMSDLAAEVTAALEDRVVEVRLDGRDVRIAVSSPSEETHAGPRTDAPPLNEADSGHLDPGHLGPGHFDPGHFGPGHLGDAGGDIRRMTLRLIDQVKDQAERAAAEQGVSLNTWVSQAVAGALRGEPWNESRRTRDDRRARNRVQGWVQG
ncbi:MAG TPA: toxin-antitoxin system HicB family antitoxin [Pseudonocardiaceae bacterium]|nr:toxin-antitoxin system HicB family antitoxin [Pseudonocardiaceae bacterium]